MEEACQNISSTTSPVNVGTIYVTMISSLCSIFGSCLIIVTFIVWPDLRSTARAILVFLATADFLTALGYLFASILFLVSIQDFDENDKNIVVSPQLCTFQSFITTTFPISSFLWTACLGVYFFMSITLNKVNAARKLVPLFHIIAWGIPLLLCIPGAATGVLGNRNTSTLAQGTAAWCWVSLNTSFDEHTSTDDIKERLIKLHVLELVFGKIWEISVFFLSIVLCIVVKISLQKRKKQVEISSEVNEYGSLNSKRMKAALTQLDQKLIWIPIVFISVRFWGTLRWLIASTYSECLEVDRNCSIVHERIWFTQPCYNVVYNQGLLYMQAIGDTGQGWANALLYVVFHATIGRRLCPCLFFCWNKLKKKHDGYWRKRDYTPMRDSDKERDQVTLSVSSRSALIETHVQVAGDQNKIHKMISGNECEYDSMPGIQRSRSINSTALS